ncbi:MULTISPECIES: ABC transporter ATP-binding protein [Brevibacillus]|uniref:ABC transporter ATP-binding protein n=1 Tax=Brevibacillus TaxID=55080 RepID=UPI00156B23B3|nr:MULTISPECIES: ABC transporter ATP-binding protein [Brevibacillus]MDH6348348.1 ABC-type nitrate/sulfonate/bicarbonate transport system ATPase subunit [Brevibacillus sp. 1238]MDR5000486.1 ABC transporter ATP-binding protein [Brevibacillus parabrevis]UED70421.1 ABC transporter ATP-binding protein [Brevibacillus sp. HD3.3A]WDV96711.1 ABC transporter ATP-binding protein [Brevibacillus parabrevis]
MEALLEFASVTKSFNGTTVLAGFSFSLAAGEVVAILGPSGCGKTTILNMAAGLIRQTSGTVTVRTEQLGYVFQEPRLIPWKTVTDNIRFVLGRMDQDTMNEKVTTVLQKVGLFHARDYYPKQLSGGMKQRVSIARALVTDPKMMLMDEPFSALDLALKRELQQDVIRLIEERRIGMVYVTHDPEEAARLADRVLLFSKSNNLAAATVIREYPLPGQRAGRSEDQIQQIKAVLHQHLTGG